MWKSIYIKFTGILLCLVLSFSCLLACDTKVDPHESESLPLSQNNSKESVSSTEPLPNVDYVLPSILPENDIVVVLEKPQITYYDQISSFRGFQFEIISQDDLSASDLEIQLDTDAGFSYFLEEVDILNQISSPNTDHPPFPLSLFQTYQNMDWKEYLDLYHANYMFVETEDESYRSKHDKFNEINDSHMAGLQKWYENNPVQYKVYTVELNLHDIMAARVDQLNQMTITYKGKTHDFDLDLSFNYDDALITASTGEENLIATIAMIGVNIPLSEDGLFQLPHIDLNVSRDLIITAMSLYGTDSVSVESANFSIQSPTMTLDQQWTSGDRLELSEGSLVRVSPLIRDESIKGRTSNHKTYYFLIKYEIDGLEGSSHCEIVAYSKANPYEAVAIHLDGIDITPYYFDFAYQMNSVIDER